MRRSPSPVRPFAILVGLIATLGWGLVALAAAHGAGGSARAALNAELLDVVARVHGLTSDQKARLTAIFSASSQIGQGNPSVTRLPMTEQACREREADAGMTVEDP